MLYEEIAKTVIGCAYKVYNTLGFGFVERVYQNALITELENAGLKVEQKKPISVYYNGVVVGGALRKICSLPTSWASVGAARPCQPVSRPQQGLARRHRPYKLQILRNAPVVGEFEADLVVEGCVIVELKSVENLVKAFEVQTVNYLTATKIDVGLPINLGPKRVEVKRKFREPKCGQE